MKTKIILSGILFLMTFATYAQSVKSNKMDSKTAVTEIKVEAENLDELKNFDWNVVKEVFLENDTEQEITLVFAYVNKSEIDKSKVRVDNFEIKLTGKTADLDKLISRLKNLFEKMFEINDREIKN